MQNGSQITVPHGDDDMRVEAGLQQLAAAALAGNWMEKIGVRSAGQVVSANELTSLSALIVYVAHKLELSEFRVERDLADRFNVPNVKCLPAARFDDAIRHLVDRIPVDVSTAA